MNQDSKFIVFWKSCPPVFINTLFPTIYNGTKDFTNKQYESINKYTGIVILCELDVNEKGEKINLQDFYGIEVAKQLRRNGVKIPILFTSFFSRKHIFNNNPEREIINTIGHDFLRLPLVPLDYHFKLKNMPILDDLELFDVQNSYCRKEGIVRELAHRLSNLKYFDLKNKSSDEVKSQIKEEIIKIASVYNLDPSKFIFEFENKFIALDEDNISDAISEVNRYGEKIIYENSPNLSTDEKIKDKRNWKLLWVDDEAENDHALITSLNEYGVTVILCKSADEATNYLNDDWQNENIIMVLLADYRLYELDEDNVKVHQPVQGYKLLKNVAESERMIRLAALSALPRKFLLKSMKEFNIRSEVYSKRDYLENNNTLKLLSEELIELGDENEDAILSLPDDASGWKYLKQTYKQFRNWFEYLSIERKISIKAKTYTDYFDKHEKLPEPIPFSKSNYKPANTPEKNMLKFQDYWLGRRIAIWLGGVREYTNDQVAEILKGEKCSDYKQVISQYLGLRMEDYPYGITIEEKNWLQYFVGIPIYKEIELQNNLLNDIHLSFHNFITKSFNTFNIPIPKINSYSGIKIFYKNVLKESGIKKEDLLNLVSKINSLLETKYNEKYFFDYPKNVFLLASYFLREYRELIKILRKDEKSIKISKEEGKIKKFYEMIKNEKYPDINKFNEEDKDLFQNIYIYSYDDDGIILNFESVVNNYRNSNNSEDILDKDNIQFDETFDQNKVKTGKKKKD